MLACPTAWLGEGLRPAWPCSQSSPTPNSPTPGSQHQHLPVLPHTVMPVQCSAPLHPTHGIPTLPASPQLCVPQPCPSPLHPLTLLPGDVVEALDALSAAVAKVCAVRRGPKPHSDHLQEEDELQLAPQCPWSAHAYYLPSVGSFGDLSRAMDPLTCGDVGPHQTRMRLRLRRLSSPVAMPVITDLSNCNNTSVGEAPWRMRTPTAWAHLH